MLLYIYNYHIITHLSFIKLGVIVRFQNKSHSSSDKYIK